MRLDIDGSFVDVYGVAMTASNVFIECGILRPGRGPSLYDPFDPPKISDGFDEYGMPRLYDPDQDLARIQRALNGNPIELAIDSVCSDFYPRFEAAMQARKTFFEAGRVALMHYSGFGIQALIFMGAMIEFKRDGLHAGIVREGILAGEIVSYRTGRASVDKQPYWEICCIDPMKGEM